MYMYLVRSREYLICVRPAGEAHFSSNSANITMRSFATVAAAAAVLSTANAFAPQAQRTPLSAAVSAPVTSSIVLNQAAEEVDPLDFTPEVRQHSFVLLPRSCVRPYPLMRACTASCHEPVCDGGASAFLDF